MKPFALTRPAPARPEGLSDEAGSAVDALHDWFEDQLSAALGEVTLDDAPSLEHLLALVSRRQAIERRDDGTLRGVLGGITYLSADEGLSWQRVPSCGMEGCSRPATRVEPEGIGFCEKCGALWQVLDQHHIRDTPFDPYWRRATVAADHGGALAEAWRRGDGQEPKSEPLDTHWPAELRARISALEEQVEEARDLARRFAAGDVIDIWDRPDWLDGDEADEADEADLQEEQEAREHGRLNSGEW